MSESHLTDTTFDQFDLDPRLLGAIADAGFSHCTPIQELTLPLALTGRDIAGQAKTGTGKTACFLLALFQRLAEDTDEDPPAGPRALVLAPTRELALQILKDAKVLGAGMPLKLGIAYGGTGYLSQRAELEAGVDVLIGTPGRIIDYYKQGVFSLDAIKVVVLDEADRMFDLGFIKDIRFLLRRMPPAEQRQNLLFSATLSLRVSELAYEHMNSPEVIKVASDTAVADRILEQAYYPSNSEKLPLLTAILSRDDVESALVFANMKYSTERIGRWLERNGIQAGVLSGDVPQPKRERLLKKFLDGELRILVATDVAARGLHIPGVSHVINYDLPNDPEDYVHRIGRTARAGESGVAISFACEDFAYNLMAIEEFIGHTLTKVSVDPELLKNSQPQVEPEHREQTAADQGRRERRGRRREKPAANNSVKENTASPPVEVVEDESREIRIAALRGHVQIQFPLACGGDRSSSGGIDPTIDSGSCSGGEFPPPRDPSHGIENQNANKTPPRVAGMTIPGASCRDAGLRR